MEPGFRGEVTDFYQRFRRGYPPAVVDHLVEAFALTRDDMALDIGCGTGQLTLPLAERVRAAVGLDPEPDMLWRARAAARDRRATNVSWLLGADTDLPALHALFGGRRLGAVTIAQALHWMDHGTLFPALAPMIRRNGGVAVVTNGKPLWQHDLAWSRALRDVLSGWLGAPLDRTCGTDAASQQRYREGLARAGFDVTTASVDYSDELSLEQVIGGVYSALPVDRLPAPERRPDFAARIGRALQPHRPYVEDVHVAIVLGTVG
ncbi:MAG TPA: methyltransferase domain-containing protein [Actinophytocola sp.]|uniref:class I SAM-dependent methyltransferase n=1 Tax=Actinophytocola sp. TaxID=1872138 RepID=UPI002DDD3A08|nr:methyltransferase domain-containing protein [Actinophytocola sp.]HEV2782475.1 methyltransferase domain-containing protein [Actinophytocola sp.]